MRDENQKTRFNSTELSLLKGLFAGNDPFLYLVRKVMYQFEITPEERETLNKTINETVFTLMHKVFNPWLDPDSPIGQTANLLQGLGAETKNLSPDGAWPFIKAKELEIDYLNQQLRILRGSGEEPKIKLSDLGNLDVPKTQREQKYIEITAWNYLVQFIDLNIGQIRILAGLKEETVEETIEKLAKNSNK